jgi:hypothetical protein
MSPGAVKNTERSALSFFAVGEIVALIFYVTVSRPMWFFQDEWDFLAGRTAFNLGDLFRAHNEHWVTLPVLVYRVLWFAFGLRTYRPYQLVVILLHLGTALLLRAVMRRVGVRPWTATVVALVFVFFGSGYQDIVLPFQMTLVGSLVFGLVHLLLATHESPIDRRDALGLAAGLAGLMCSGVAVSMVVAVGVAVLMIRGWRPALLHTVPLGAIYLVWYVAIGHNGYSGYRAGLADVARFVRKIVAATFGAIGQHRGVGPLIALLLVGGLALAWIPLRGAERRRRAAIPFALLVGGLSLLVITGLGRAGLSSFQEKSRYLHITAALVLPALAVAAEAVMRRWRMITPVILVVLVIGVPGNIDVIRKYMHTPIVTKQETYKRLILTLPRLPVAKEVDRDSTPETLLARFVTVGWLLDGVASGRIPRPDHISRAERAVDTIRLSLGQRHSPPLKGATCVRLADSLVFHLEKGEYIYVRGAAGTLSITPATVEPAGTYPNPVVGTSGPIIFARAPVTFRLTSFSPLGGGAACATKELIDAAQAASKTP